MKLAEKLEKEQIEKGKGRIGALGVPALNSNGKVYNRTNTFQTGNGKVKVARMVSSKVSGKKLAEYRAMAKKALREAQAGNAWYASNFR